MCSLGRHLRWPPRRAGRSGAGAALLRSASAPAPPGLDLLGSRLRLVYYAQRGHGRSGRPAVDTLTIEQLADDAAALAARLDGGPVLVLGHFHGASVAQELAVRHPERVAGLVLVA